MSLAALLTPYFVIATTSPPRPPRPPKSEFIFNNALYRDSGAISEDPWQEATETVPVFRAILDCANVAKESLERLAFLLYSVQVHPARQSCGGGYLYRPASRPARPPLLS